MRDIKFRAWMNYGNHAEMIHNIQNHITGAWAFGYLVDNRVEGVDVTVMQYTGLKDKNYVEVYEGDVVDCWDNCGFEGVSASLRGIVVFNGGCFCVKGSNGHHNKLALTCAEEIEVIGNIYENPELLNE